ncbi:MAG: hypothetical protein ACYS0G_03420, partial [Planctomycetota bacterium]
MLSCRQSVKWAVIAAAVVAAMMLTSAAAEADTISWDGGGDGVTFEDPFNWMPDTVPGFFDWVIFDPPAPKHVEFASSPTNQRLDVSGNVTFDLNGRNYSLARIAFPSIEVDGTLTISDGDVYSATGVRLQSGSLIVDGGFTDLDVLADDLDVGDPGPASLIIQNGAEVQCVSAYIATVEGSQGGTVIVTGDNSIWGIQDVLGVGNDGPGDLILSAGGLTFSRSALVGVDEVTGDGSVTITDAGSAWFNLGLAHVGAWGAGSVDITEGGMMWSESALVGSFAGSVGVATLEGSGSTWDNAFELHIGHQGSGALSVSNGASIACTSGVVGAFAGSDGTVLVDGAGSSWTSAFSLTIGSFGTGSLVVTNSGTVAAPHMTISDSGDVGGDGILDADVLSEGVVSPGLSVGTLTVQGDYEQDASGRLEIELNDLGNDVLAVADYAVVAGTLDIALIDGFIPELGQEFTIVTST